MKMLDKLLLAGVAAFALTVGSASAADMPKRVGYVVNYATHEWYQNVIKGMKAHAAELGIELEVKDANLDVAKEVSAAEDFMSAGVDVLIITPVNEEGVVPLLKRAKEANMPVVLEGNPVKGMTTLVAICDYDTGYNAGVEAGKYAKDKLGGVAKVMNVGLPLLSATVLRSNGFMDGIHTIIPDATLVHDLDGGGNPDRALEVSTAALAQNADINIIYGINDSSSLGGLQAWKAAGKPMISSWSSVPAAKALPSSTPSRRSRPTASKRRCSRRRKATRRWMPRLSSSRSRKCRSTSSARPRLSSATTGRSTTTMTAPRAPSNGMR